MLTDESLLDEHAKKWLVGMKKEINERREYEAARAAMAAERMQAEEAAKMAAEQAAQMARRVLRLASDPSRSDLNFILACGRGGGIMDGCIDELSNCGEFMLYDPCA